ncbi:MAG: maleylacetoacetate isomerase [Gammaproteobacteria bacterium]|nr:maleylacetoacetate isomerase [Gammaproteobacteria bacterium]
MRLHHYFRSSASFRVRIALNLKGLEHEAVPVDLRAPVSAQRTPEYLALNPEGLVPVLSDGAHTIRQSLAIIEYLEELRPAPPLLPRDPVPRAQVRALAYAIACDIHPLNNLRVLNYLREHLEADQAALDAWYAHWVGRGFAALEREVAQTSADGRHTFGAGITLADVCLVPQMYNAHRFRCDVTPYPRLRAICAHLEGLPAFARAVPEAQPEAAAS